MALIAAKVMFICTVVLEAACICQGVHYPHNTIQPLPIKYQAQLYTIGTSMERHPSHGLGSKWSHRRLKQHADPTYFPYNAARTVRSGSSGPRSQKSLTYEDAEAAANAGHKGMRSVNAPANRQSYATARPQHNQYTEQRKEAIQPRAQVGIDRPPGLVVTSGTPSAGILAIGGASFSQTYEGALAVATSDSLPFARDPATASRFGPTSVAANKITSRPSSIVRASRAGSLAATNEPAGSVAASGSANSDIRLAQADVAVALVQTEKVDSLENKKYGSQRFDMLGTWGRSSGNPSGSGASRSGRQSSSSASGVGTSTGGPSSNAGGPSGTTSTGGSDSTSRTSGDSGGSSGGSTGSGGGAGGSGGT